jgi:uncharacterized protein YndB with AHSA1/START domain
MTTNSIVNGNEVVHTRFINAPREEVFDAWVNPHKLDKWWGPDGFTITNLEVNMQAAGCWRFIMHGPDGTDYPNRVTYSEIEIPARISFSHDDDSDGKSEFSKKVSGFETHVTFETKDGGTLVTMRTVMPSAEALQYVIENFNALEGGKQTLGNLEAFCTKS